MSPDLGMGHWKSYWGGGGNEVLKKSCKGKLREKNSCTASSPEKNVLAYGKKYSCKGNVNEKNSCSSKFSHPSPLKFLMVRPLNLSKELGRLGGDRGCKHPAFCYPKSLFLSAKYYTKGCNLFPFPANLRIPFSHVPL